MTDQIIVTPPTPVEITVATGTVGPQGPTGPTGPANTLAIGTVVNGGSASATITGTAPSQILNLVLPQGPTGAAGPTGSTGATGANGQGVPAGGTTGQVLAKIDGTNYNTQWIATPATGVTSITATAPLTGGTITTSGSIGIDQTALAITPSQVTGTAVITTDSRLSNARTPTAHASTHASGGTDPVSISSSQVSDIATLYVPQTGSTTVTGTQTLIPASSGTVPLVLQALSGQSANMLTVNANGATTKIDAFGQMFFSGSRPLTIGSTQFTNTSVALNAYSATTIPLGIRGAASQTADLQQWQNSAGTILSRVKADGTPTFSYGTFFGTQALSADGDAVRPLTLKGFSSAQTGNLVEYLTSGSTILGGTNAVGQTYTGSTTPILTAVGGATTATTGTGTTATVTLTSASNLAVGDLITVAGITPTGYNGTFVVTAVSNTSPFSVSYANATTGAQTVAGTVSVPAQASITTRSAGTIGLVVKTIAGQSGDAQQWQAPNGGINAYVGQDGRINTSNGIAATTSIRLGSYSAGLGGGSGVFGIQNASVAPTSNPTGGGVLYASAGALNYIGTSGTAAAIVNADGTRTLDGGTA